MPFTPLDPSTAQAAQPLNIGAPGVDGMQLQDIQTEIIDQLQGRSDIAPAGDYTRLNRWINWGYYSISGMLDLKELWASFALATVASQPFYMLPPQVAWIKRVTVDDDTDFLLQGGMELAAIDEQTYRNMGDTDDLLLQSPVVPASWFRYGRMLVLYPTPDSAYNLAIDCRVRPLPLTNAQDCPMLPEEFHEAVTYEGLSRAWRALRNPQAAAVAHNDALAVIRPILNTDAEERDALHVGFTPIRSRAGLYRGRI